MRSQVWVRRVPHRERGPGVALDVQLPLHREGRVVQAAAARERVHEADVLISPDHNRQRCSAIEGGRKTCERVSDNLLAWNVLVQVTRLFAPARS